MEAEAGLNLRPSDMGCGCLKWLLNLLCNTCLIVILVMAMLVGWEVISTVDQISISLLIKDMGIISSVYWAFVLILQRNNCPSPLSTFNWSISLSFLTLRCKSSLHILDHNLSPHV